MSDPGSAATQPQPYPAGGELPPLEDGGLEDLDGWVPRPRTNRVTPFLVAGLVAVAGFAGGIVADRRLGTTAATPAVAFGAGARAFGGAAGGQGFGGQGFGGQGFGGQGFGQSGPPGAGTGAGAGAGAGAGGAASGVGAAPPVLVGTVTKVTGSTLTVRNFAGASVVVHVAPGTPVTVSGLGGLRPGLAVAVSGTKAADGSVTATAVVNRTAG